MIEREHSVVEGMGGVHIYKECIHTRGEEVRFVQRVKEYRAKAGGGWWWWKQGFNVQKWKGFRR